MILERSISPFERFGEFVPVADAELSQHVFVAGETLSGVAARFLGDWRLWRTIADRNKTIDPRQIAPGTLLVIPRRPLELGSFESF